MTTDRMPPIADGDMTEAQAAAADELISGPRGALAGPFIPLLRSPELMARVQKLGEFLRFESRLPAAVKELVILTVARHFTQPYEWAFHLPLALKAGISHAACQELSWGRRPEELNSMEHAAYDLAHEALAGGTVSDETYRRCELAFGQSGVVELTALCGYYALLAMVMNTVQTPAPLAEIPLH